MKRFTKSLIAGFAALAMLGAFVSCSSDDDSSNPFKDIEQGGGTTGTDLSSKTIETDLEKMVGEVVFEVTEDSVTEADTVFFIKYNRSAAGANELVKISDAEINVFVNEKCTATYDSIEFALDEYGATFDPADKDSVTGKVSLETNMVEYKTKPLVGAVVKAGDTVRLQVIKGDLKAVDEGAEISWKKLEFALIDITPPAYYKEIAAKEFAPLTMKTQAPAAGEWGDPFEGSGFAANEAMTEFTYTLCYGPLTKSSVKLVLQNKDFPVTDDKAEPGHNFKVKGTFTLKLNDEVIWDAVEKTFELENNMYGIDYQCKTAILVDKDLKGGDKVVLSVADLKVVAKTAEDAAAITKITTTIIDDSEVADWWTDLLWATKEEADAKENVLWTGTAVVPAPDEEPAADENVLLDEIWSADWQTKRFAAEKFAKANAGSKIVFTVSKDTDRLVGGTAAAPDYSECYTLIQIIDLKDATGGKLGAGTAEGATLNVAAGQLEGMFKDEDPNTKFYEVAYIPSAEEWENIKANGVGVQAHGTMFKKIELVIGEDAPSAGQESKPGTETGSAPVVPQVVTIIESATTPGWIPLSLSDDLVGAKVGDYVVFELAGQSDLQFIKSSWAGLGKGVIEIMDSYGWPKTWYAGDPNVPEEDWDRPSVTPNADTTVYYFEVTEAFNALKGDVCIAGPATVNYMKLMTAEAFAAEFNK